MACLTPLGYKIVDKHYVIDNDEADAIRLILIYLLLDIATKIYTVLSPSRDYTSITDNALKQVFTILSETSAIAASTHLIKFLRIMANATLIPKNVLLISSVLKMLFLPLLAKEIFQQAQARHRSNKDKPAEYKAKVNYLLHWKKSSVVTVVLWEVILAPP